MTRKDLFNEWERQEPLELDKEKLGTAFSKVLKKIDSVESVMENEKAHRKSGSYVFRKVAIYSSVAAAAVICVTLAFTSVSKKAYNRGLYAHIQEMPVNMTEYSTSNGEIRRVTLPDSSKVILNAGSVLICPERFGAGGREVYLSGEAVFDVTGDTGRAFVVKTSNLNVKVHGTRFNVSAYSDSRLVSATLCRGSISAMNNEGGAPVRHVVDGIHNPRETKVGVKVLLGQRLIRKISVGKIQMRLPGLGPIYGHIRCHPEQVGADPCDIHKRVADKPQPHKHTLCDILRIIIRLEK